MKTLSYFEAFDTFADMTILDLRFALVEASVLMLHFQHLTAFNALGVAMGFTQGVPPSYEPEMIRLEAAVSKIKTLLPND